MKDILYLKEHMRDISEREAEVGSQLDRNMPNWF